MLNLNHELLNPNLSIEEAKQLQEKYRSKMHILQSDYIISSFKDINNIAGVDISYFKLNNEEFGVSCVVLWNLIKQKVEDFKFYKDKINFPYQAGFLGFRECKLISLAINELPRLPDLIMCDGHGIIHPRRFGEAVQLGLALNIPSIGVAKNPYVGYFEWSSLKRKKGNKVKITTSELKNSKPEVLGYAICLKDDVKPVFISVGYRTTLKLAIEVGLVSTLNHRQPEPLYLAHFLSKEKVKEFL